MALFKKPQRKRTRRGQEDHVAIALDLLTGLCGVWTGVRYDFDLDQRATSAGSDKIRRSLCVEFERSPDGAHVIAHNEVFARKRHRQNFDVWGREASTGELFRTVFAEGTRQTNVYDILSLERDRTGRTWHLVMETVSWDEARPCEFRYEISRNHNQLNLKLERCLINHTAGYELVSQAKLIRAP